MDREQGTCEEASLLSGGNHHSTLVDKPREPLSGAARGRVKGCGRRLTLTWPEAGLEFPDTCPVCVEGEWITAEKTRRGCLCGQVVSDQCWPGQARKLDFGVAAQLALASTMKRGESAVAAVPS